jgi:hypothetical protein
VVLACLGSRGLAMSASGLSPLLHPVRVRRPDRPAAINTSVPWSCGSKENDAERGVRQLLHRYQFASLSSYRLDRLGETAYAPFGVDVKGRGIDLELTFNADGRASRYVVADTRSLACEMPLTKAKYAHMRPLLPIEEFLSD